MSTLLLLALPLVGIGAYALLRAVRRRALPRYSLRVLLSLLLLVYFGATAGLGIFWVANQELPVFDLHYLLGYLTLALVVVHVVLGWRPLASFFRRRSPEVLLRSDGRAWRPAVRKVWVVLGLVLYGGVAFLVGLRQGAETITISRVRDGPSERQGSGRVLASIERHKVTTDDGETFLADFYQRRTAHTRASVITRSGGLDLATRPEVFKRYPGVRTLPLPRGFVAGAVDVAEAIEARRVAADAFAPKRMTQAELAHILHHTYGITGEHRGTRLTLLRSAPSAGALYPTVIYVLVRDVEGLPAGLYHYGIDGRELHLLGEGDLARDLSSFVSRGDLVEEAAVTVILSVVFFRTSWKYGERSYRYVNMDTGHVVGNLTLSASALGYGTHLIGRFDDDRLDAFVGVDGTEEAVLLVVPMGGPAGGSRGGVRASEREPVFRSAFDARGLSDEALVPLIHEGTKLAVVAGAQAARQEPPARRGAVSRDSIRLPRTSLAHGDLFESIRSRRSSRRFSKRGIPLETLSTLLFHGMGETEEGRSYPRVQETDALGFHVVVNQVEGLDPGVYSYDPREHALAPVRRGSQRHRVYEAALFQDAVGDADVAFVKTVDLERLAFPDGDRGLRYAFMDAGLVGENLYLTAVGLGLGVCGIGAFFDEEVSALLELDPRKEAVAYITAVGARAE